jgi:hypothetical protein
MFAAHEFAFRLSTWRRCSLVLRSEEKEEQEEILQDLVWPHCVWYDYESGGWNQQEGKLRGFK